MRLSAIGPQFSQSSSQNRVRIDAPAHFLVSALLGAGFRAQRRLSVNRFIINEKNGDGAHIATTFISTRAHRLVVNRFIIAGLLVSKLSRESGAEALKAAATELKTSDHRFRCLSIVRNNGYSRV